MKKIKTRIIAMSIVVASVAFGGVFLNDAQAGPFGRYGAFKDIVLEPGGDAERQCVYSLFKRDCDLRTYNQE
ncbi:MAG: hypothetical protein ACI9Z3_001072 [Roseivirga sp.]|jgi:hypothetical protein